MTFCSAEYLMCTDRADELCPLALLPHCPSFFPKSMEKEPTPDLQGRPALPSQQPALGQRPGSLSTQEKMPKHHRTPDSQKAEAKGKGFYGDCGSC